MRKGHTTGLTSAMSYPLSACLAWAALNCQRAARSDNARWLWATAEDLGLVLQ